MPLTFHKTVGLDVAVINYNVNDKTSVLTIF